VNGSEIALTGYGIERVYATYDNMAVVLA